MAANSNISVITCVYNGAGTITHAIESANAQNYANVTHVFIDGASKDNTLEVIEATSTRDKTVVSEPDNGIYDAFNKGLQHAQGDVVGYLHADDVYASTDVLTSVAQAFTDPSVSAVYGDLQYVDSQNLNKVIRNWRSKPFDPGALRHGWMPPHPTLYVRRSFYERIGGFDASYRIAGDYKAILQLFTQSDFKAVYLPKVFVKMRTGGASNRSLSNITRKSREDYRALRETQVGGAMALLKKNVSKVGQFFHYA